MLGYSAISEENGKVLNVEAISRMCKECKFEVNLKKLTQICMKS